jgi:hypothetical protein
MKCGNCRGIVVGEGFFIRIVHEQDCPRVKATRIAMEYFGAKEELIRCEICKENMSPKNTMCNSCAKDLPAQGSATK